ncbi:MAG: type I-C CRISPR-associated protein Cas8c/Csd1 [Ruminococcus sp.]|nr:type I-C CRISPR-associated protein Cas8c/Csd1 [Ruminococcus sp.]
MSWISMLYQTYENNVGKAGENGGGKALLSRVAHMLANAQIEITIDKDGGFISAAEVPKENRQIFIPITEKSSGRTTGIAPHPIFDNLSYAAGDYEKYAETEKSAEKAHNRFQAYREGLNAWCESEYSHPKARAVLKYTDKCGTIYDLVQSGLVKFDENGKFAKAKIQGTPYEKCIVRYRVVGTGEDTTSAAWEDKTLSDSFIGYYLSEQPGERNICFVSGREAAACINHPKGIISSSYGAKLISANDSIGFTYLGRFITSDEACTVSYEVSQKAHSALTWLAANQGVSFGGRTFVCWNPVGKDIPNPAMDFGTEIMGDTAEHFQKKLYKAFIGYEEMLDDNDDIVIIALDAATTGRLSITPYNELKSSDFIRNYRSWCESLKWRIPEFTPEGKYTEPVHTLKTRRIIDYAFGDEQNGMIKAADKVMKEHSQRIIGCMINNQKFPQDIAHALAVKASNPLAYSSINANRVLAYACAAIAKCHKDNQEGVKYDMELDNNNSNRSYLFGRLLAVAEKVEQTAMYVTENRESRETNAMRLRSAFVNHPMHTWGILEEALSPYYAKLGPRTREFYRQLAKELLYEIGSACTAAGRLDEGLLNKRLEDVYLIGYSSQFHDFRSNIEKQEEN